MSEEINEGTGMTPKGTHHAGGGTVYGCLTAFLILATGSAILLLVATVGDCEPTPHCKTGGRPVLLEMLVAVPVVAALLGFVVRLLAGRVSGKISRSSRPAAVLINLLLALLAAWLGYEAIINFPVN